VQAKALKLKKCKVCREEFTPRNPMQTVCGPSCAYEIVKKAAEKKIKQAQADQRKTDRAKRQQQKTLPTLKKEAQREFNRFIRLRDSGKPCICCGFPIVGGAIGGAVDCGHYRSVGSAPGLRFNENNAHAQRKVCNRWGAGRAVDYRIGLINRIGLAAVEALEADNSVRKYTREELVEIRNTYRKRANELEKAKAL
jgi:hypothetical protein